MRNTHNRTWIMSQNMASPRIWLKTLKNLKIEKYTQQKMDYGERTEKRGK